VLQRRDVLELVDHEAAVALAELVGDLGGALQRAGGVDQQVVEVELLGAVLELLVGLVDLSHLLDGGGGVALGRRGGARVGVGRDEARLSPLDLAREAEKRNEVPIGAVIVRDGSIIAAGSNRTIRDQDPTAHAELLAIREASSKLDRWRLNDCTLYVTLEPCAMCAGAIVLSRIKRVVFGAWDDKAGMGGSVGDLLRHPRLNHRPEVRAGVLASECGALLEEFFKRQRVEEGSAAG